MKLASLRTHHPDGQLVVVSRDLQTMVDASDIAPTLIHALEHWEHTSPALQALYESLNQQHCAQAQPFATSACTAPLPRAPQWLDASAFLNHGHLMAQAFNTPPIPNFDTVPVMYQGASDDFLGPSDTVAFASEADGIDFEGEFGVITGPVPMACTPTEGLGAVRLLVQINDWSLRALGAQEVRTGFGFLQAKPSSSFAPVAITPDELGDAWQHGRVQLPLEVEWNGQWFGHAHGGEMNFSFGELIAHAARTRRLSAGCIVGSGTVSNARREVGSSCIAERRVIEIIDHGKPSTQFMRFGDRVRMTARAANGAAPFGSIDQTVVAYLRQPNV